MKKILVILLLLISDISFGQKINYSISASYNQPYIASIEESQEITTSVPASTGYISYTNLGHLKESYSSKSGGKVRGNISYSVNSRLIIESGLQFNLIRYQKSSEVIMDDYESISFSDLFGDPSEVFEVGETYGGLTGTIVPRDDNSDLLIDNTDNILVFYDNNDDKLGNTTTLYTEIPIKFGYSFFQNKLKFKLGVITSILSYNAVYESNYEINSTEIIKDKTADGFSNVMWNGNIEIDYQIFKTIGVNLNYTRSFNSIYDEDASIGKPKFNIFSLGLSYHFSKKL